MLKRQKLPAANERKRIMLKIYLHWIGIIIIIMIIKGNLSEHNKYI